MPKRLTKEESTATETYAKFIAEPFETGYGHTIGNSIRRVLLSSLEGAAITSIKVDGAMHEFTGSYIPFAESAEERQATGDPRRAVLERYSGPAAYVAAIAEAAKALVAEGLMLGEDIETCVKAAAGWGRPRHDIALE